MSFIAWLCGPCFEDAKNMDSDVSRLTVVPTPGGGLVAVSEAGVGVGVPCLAQCTIVHASIVQDSSHDMWDPIGPSMPCRV